MSFSRLFYIIAKKKLFDKSFRQQGRDLERTRKRRGLQTNLQTAAPDFSAPSAARRVCFTENNKRTDTGTDTRTGSSLPRRGNACNGKDRTDRA